MPVINVSDKTTDRGKTKRYFAFYKQNKKTNKETKNNNKKKQQKKTNQKPKKTNKQTKKQCNVLFLCLLLLFLSKYLLLHSVYFKFLSLPRLLRQKLDMQLCFPIKANPPQDTGSRFIMAIQFCVTCLFKMLVSKDLYNSIHRF